MVIILVFQKSVCYYTLEIVYIKEADMAGCIITISREYGSGGRLIGQALAEQLNIPFYDRELVKIISEKSGLSEKFISEAELYREEAIKYAGYDVTLQMPLTNVVFHAESEVISKIADEGDCVIVGRCADYVLQDRKDVLDVFVYASMENRIERIKKLYGDKVSSVKSFITRYDKDRAAYYDYYTDKKWGDLRSYHLSVNSDMGINSCVEIIKTAYNNWKDGVQLV